MVVLKFNEDFNVRYAFNLSKIALNFIMQKYCSRIKLQPYKLPLLDLAFHKQCYKSPAVDFTTWAYPFVTISHLLSCFSSCLSPMYIWSSPKRSSRSDAIYQSAKVAQAICSLPRHNYAIKTSRASLYGGTFAADVIETSHILTEGQQSVSKLKKSALAQTVTESPPYIYTGVYYSYYLSMNGFDVWNKIIFMFAAQRQYTHTPCGNNNNILDASPVKWNAVCVVRSGGAAAAAHRCRRPPLREAINRESRLLNAHCGSLRFFLSRNTHILTAALAKVESGRPTHAEWKQTRRFSHHASHFTTN